MFYLCIKGLFIVNLFIRNSIVFIFFFLLLEKLLYCCYLYCVVVWLFNGGIIFNEEIGGIVIGVCGGVGGVVL